MTLTVTLNQIYTHRPCAESWRKALKHLGKTKPDDMEISFRDIVDVMGIEDAIWCLRALPDEYAGAVRLLACDFAESFSHCQAIDVAGLYARRAATDEELSTTWAASVAAARVATMSATRAATMADEREKQKQIFLKWLKQFKYASANRSRAAQIGWRTRRLAGAKRCPHCETLHTDLLGHVYRRHPRGIGDLWHGLLRLWRRA